MGKVTGVQFSDATQNFWQGCRKVSAGCKNCYMFRDMARWNKDGNNIHRSTDNTFYKPLHWKEPKKIFTCSWSDFFIEEADAWRADAWEVIRNTPQHTWQIITKRPERIAQCLPPDWGPNGWKNVILIATVEDQESADLRIPIIEQHYSFDEGVKVGLIFEPLLEQIRFDKWIFSRKDDEGLKDSTLEMYVDWIIIGGESGNDQGRYRYRECKLWWIEDIVREFQHNTPVFVKQLGTHLAKQLNLVDRHGGDFNEFPEGLKVREFPI
jgi:protein gp37